MNIAINGTGVAGPALAWWLKHYGHEPVLFERAPALRTGGYLIDFWGTGYRVAERMGLVPALRERGYLIEELRMVNARGKCDAKLKVGSLRSMLNNRFMSIARGDIAATIHRACGNVQTRFGESIVGIEDRGGEVLVHTSKGVEEKFDLVIGADGLHSAVRTLVFGPESKFEKHLGFHVAAFALKGYQPRDELAYVSHTAPRKQVSRVSLREDWTLFLFVFKSELIAGAGVDEPREILRQVFGNLQWEVPGILERMEEATEIYYDAVSQIRMDRWTRGRVALLGDAAACASLLAGEGTGLALVEAYVLAGELHRSGGDHAAAFARYEALLKPLLATKQKSALNFAGFFAPSSRFRIWLRDMGMRAAALPVLAKFLIWRSLRDDFDLPEYATTGMAVVN